MAINEASWDRAGRLLFGLFLLSLTFTGPRTPWGLLGLLPLATGIWGFCPLYRMLGFSTCLPASGKA
jgi:hypothetical protein